MVIQKVREEGGFLSLLLLSGIVSLGRYAVLDGRKAGEGHDAQGEARFDALDSRLRAFQVHDFHLLTIEGLGTDALEDEAVADIGRALHLQGFDAATILDMADDDNVQVAKVLLRKAMKGVNDIFKLHDIIIS